MDGRGSASQFHHFYDEFGGKTSTFSHLLQICTFMENLPKKDPFKRILCSNTHPYGQHILVHSTSDVPPSGSYMLGLGFAITQINAALASLSTTAHFIYFKKNTFMGCRTRRKWFLDFHDGKLNSSYVSILTIVIHNHC